MSFENEEKLVSDTLWLNINITYDCNMKCRFCYLLAVPTKPETMSEETADCLVKRYEEHVKKYGFSDRHGFAILGGEPLLYADKVKELFYKITSVAPIRSRFVFTNGLLLNSDFVNWAKENKMVIILSVNDSDLSFLDEKLKLISGQKLSLLSVSLTEKNLDRLRDIVLLANRHKVNLRMYHDHNGPSNERYIKKYDEVVVSVIKEIVEKKYNFNPYFFFEKTVPWRKEQYFSYSCGFGHFSIEPNGDVKSCPAVDTVIGNIFDENFDFVALSKKHIFRFHYNGIEECERCEYKTICGGGDPCTKMRTFGTDKKRFPLCESFKKIFPLIYKMADERIKSNKNLRW